jgi:hypothetical protein
MVVREGLAAWLDHQTVCPREAPAPVAATPLVPGGHYNIVCVLASMAMAGRKEMHS